ncbi:NifU family protein [Gabonibacter chumensis]|uniref:NifU family protein n=1 Tax=Gabonibacter chumensis TaxID=2972474 RepID=UPI00257237BE|nr:NifU family protein [Gabonibacter chumensis]MCR9011385.1 NifU family protein [Gabonibacter chumensis]
MKTEIENKDSQNILFSRVEQVIDREIRPLLRKHGGDIIIREIRGRDIRVSLLGACHRCPAAQITIEETVQVILSKRLGEDVGKILLVNEMDPELLDFAKQLLKIK